LQMRYLKNGLKLGRDLTDDITQGDWDYLDYGKHPFAGNPGRPLEFSIDGNGISIDDHRIAFGSSNDDIIEGSGKSDRLFGAEGNDTLKGGAGNDYLEGGTGSDTYRFSGDFGQDTVRNDDSSAGRLDTLLFTDLKREDVSITRSGDHLVIKDRHSDNQVTVQYHFYKNDGDTYRIDKIRFADGSELDSAALKEIVQQGSDGDDYLVANPEGSTLYGKDGNDTIYGKEGDDNLHGDNGNDRISAGAGNDMVSGGAGNDSLYGEAGDDQLSGDDGNDSIYGGAGNDNDDAEGHGPFPVLAGDPAGEDDGDQAVGADDVTGEEHGVHGAEEDHPQASTPHQATGVDGGLLTGPGRLL